MLRTLLTLSTGGLCALGVWFQQDEPAEKSEFTVELRATTSQDEVADATKIAAELQELRSQLLTVLGPNHPAVRKIDVQIRQITAEGSLAENLFAPQIVQFRGPGAMMPGQGGAWVGDAWMFSQSGDAASPMFLATEDAPVELDVTRQVVTGPMTSALAGVQVDTARAFGFGSVLAALRQKWEKSDSDETRQAVVEELKQTITEQFDADLARRRQQVDDLEKKLGELRKQIEKREARREDFVQVLTQHTEMEWEGISLQSEQRTRVITAPNARQRALLNRGIEAPATTTPESTPPAESPK